MPTRKFKFVSPGIFLDEVDNSQLPATPTPIGPVIIGRTERGPAMEPVQVNSFSDFVEVFGYPTPGGQGGDVWRDGNKVAPTYAAYAAQAYLRNNSPITMVRLLGAQSDDATAAGRAGFDIGELEASPPAAGATDHGGGGAYGLWLFNSSSTAAPQCTGTLAAIWYLQTGSIVLNGTMRGGTGVAAVTGTAVMVNSNGTHQFEAIVKDGEGANLYTTSFNFNRDSSKFIRKVFNTNPSLLNTNITTTENQENYFLGETFERAVNDVTTTDITHGVILGMGQHNVGGTEHQTFKYGTRGSRTGWFLSQDRRSVTPDTANGYNPTSTAMSTKLFRLISLKTGQWDQQNIKVSIQDIKASTNSFNKYGTFTVAIRKMNDSDNSPQIVERFSGCNLNPNSPDYVARKIGDRYKVWDNVSKRYREYGNFVNMSKFIRIEMNPSVDNGAIEDTLLPFGVYGAPQFNDFKLVSGSVSPYQPLRGVAVVGANSQSSSYARACTGTGTKLIASVYDNHRVAMGFMCVGSASFQGHCQFPTVPLRISSSAGNLPNPALAYWGAATNRTNSTVFDDAIVDMIKGKPGDGSAPTYTDESMVTTTSGALTPMWVFSLHDVTGTHAAGSTTEFGAAIYRSGSYAEGASISARSSTGYQATLNAGFDRFTTLLHGGFDGLDVTEAEPFANRVLNTNAGETTNYAFYSVKRAIDTVRDPEVVEMNAAAMPGIWHSGLTTHLINTCEDRADALAVIDLQHDYQPPSENNSGDAASGNRGDIDQAISTLQTRGLNSSYGCCFYPWVQIRDTTTGQLVWMPPSVAALGTFASTERRSEVWFAPAGFTRGGLSQGAAGLPVVGVKQRLTSTDRDKLYAANINPIASFPSEGIVIFGQKTLQVTPSALDRINVRRLMIYIKKEISKMAATVLFDQNVKTTWNGFLGRVEPFLRSVKSRLGLTDFRVVLDETTTTPDLIDRNIMYAKIFLKPARAIEFIAIDFVITDSGASFED